GLTQTVTNTTEDDKDADGGEVDVTITDHDDFTLDNGYFEEETQTVIQIQTATQTQIATQIQTAIQTQIVTQIRTAIQTQIATQIQTVIQTQMQVSTHLLNQ
ncbi:hypothetical protein APW06_13580, partial [Staphylococcus aureus]